MNMPASQNRSNYAFRYGFLRLDTDSATQSGLKEKTTKNAHQGGESVFCA
jgi:hypothetical protein